MSNDKSDNSFPYVDLIPKKETAAYDFVQEFPNYNGKDVKIGILDTGVDPNAHALSLENTVDCTGSGNVSVRFETKAKLDSTKSYWQVTGLSGRILKLNPNLPIKPFPKSKEDTAKEESKEDDDDAKEESKEDGDAKEESKEESKKEDEFKQDNDDDNVPTVPVRLGIKRAYELFPSKLVSRVKSHRSKLFQRQVSQYILEIQEKMLELEALPQKENDTKKKKSKEDLQARLDYLKQQLQEKDQVGDPGPLYDIVVYYDGTHHRALVDCDETGNLLHMEKRMTNFDIEQQWSTFGTVDQYNYAVQFYSNGQVLNIVSDAGAHGSHVAGIAASHQQNDDTHNGVAPGAQVVSLKIGDTRLGSMETGTSLARAMMEAVKQKCHVINLSYGEGCAMANHGRLVEAARELVYKHNVMFVSSAGNNGPALSTVGAPGGTTSGILGVGAHVSPPAMMANYSLMPTDQDDNKDRLVGTTYTWSSVGPTVDGDLGVNVMAPGGAITSVPNWTMQKKQLMNGTSMSSPHVAGCVALLISACLAEGIPHYTPNLLRAIQNTAKPDPKLSVLQQGFGMIQVKDAWEYLVQHKDCKYNQVHFDVEIENKSGKPRGVYLRQYQESMSKQTFSIHVKPQFGSNDSVHEDVQRCRIDFEMQFQIKATEPWIQVPKHVELLHNGRSFKIEVDPTKLQEGQVHTAMVLGTDAQTPSRGVMFSIPITIVKPMPEQNYMDLGELEFEPAEIKRHFLSVPYGSTWMDVTVRDCRTIGSDDQQQDSSARLVALHSVQLLPHEAYRNAEVAKYFNLLPSETTVTSIPVHAGIACELDLARYWSTSGTTKMNVVIQFRGVMPVPQEIQMTCGGGKSQQVCVQSYIMDETIQPTAKLTKYKTCLRPKKSENESCITPLDKDRDLVPSMDKRIYQLILTYEFTQQEAGSFVPRAPALQGYLYESVYESQLLLMFDEHKKYLGAGDSWPSQVNAPKGKVIIRLQVRHDSVTMLEKLQDMPLWIERKLEKEIALSAYAAKQALMVGTDTFKKRVLQKGTTASVFFAEPTKLPAGCKCGDVLFGTVTYCAQNASLPGNGKRPNGFPISFVVGPKVEENKKENNNNSTPLPDERSVSEKLQDAIRDTKVGYLSKLITKEKQDGKFEELYQELVKEYPTHIPLLMAGLQHVDDDSKKRQDDVLEKVVAAANQVLEQISQDDLALYFGKNLHDKDDPKSCQTHKEKEELKSNLVEALARKARAIAEMNSQEETFDEVLAQLKQWQDLENHKFAVLVLEREERAGHYGNMLLLLQTLISANGEPTQGGFCPMTKADLMEKRTNVLERLKWTILVESNQKWNAICNPKDYMLF